MDVNNRDKELLLDLTKHLEYALLELLELQKDKISSEECDNTYGYLLAMAKKADDYVLSLSEDKQAQKQEKQHSEQVAAVSESLQTISHYRRVISGFVYEAVSEKEQNSCEGCCVDFGYGICSELRSCDGVIWIKVDNISKGVLNV